MSDERRITLPVSRRKFLGLSVIAAAPTALFQTSRGSTDPTVVIGAGLAGLRAAELLRRAGRPVLVLEARERAGGRVLTVRSSFDDGLHAEAGPIRISSAHRSVLQLVRSLRLTLVPFESSIGSSVVSVAGVVDRSPQALAHKLASELKPEERGLSPLELLERYVGKISSDLADPVTTAASYAKWTDYDRLTWPAWLSSRGASPGAVKLMTLGGDAEDVSALYVLRQFALSRSSTQLYKIQGGMDLLPRAMASALGSIVRYNAPVVRVSRSPARFRVDYESSAQVRSVTASHVIFAVPMTTLRQIEIVPRLSPRKERGINEAAYANGTRILLQCRSRFWMARASMDRLAPTEPRNFGTAPTTSVPACEAYWEPPPAGRSVATCRPGVRAKTRRSESASPRRPFLPSGRKSKRASSINGPRSDGRAGHSWRFVPAR